MNLPPEIEWHRRRVIATHAINAAIAGEDTIAEHHVSELVGDATGNQRRERLLAGVHTWIGMCAIARNQRSAYVHAQARPPADPDTSPADQLPPHVRVALSTYNLGMAGRWREAGETFGLALAHGDGNATTFQILWICARALTALGYTTACTNPDHDH